MLSAAGDVGTADTSLLNRVGAMLGLMAPDYPQREVFCCGPEHFMHAVRDMLSGLGFDMDHYCQESFHAPPPEAELVPDDVLPQEGGAAQVTFGATAVTQARANRHDPDDCASGGTEHPSGCSMGIWRTCRIQTLSGEVHNGGFTDDDIEDGCIFACCSRPMGAVTVDA
ncbi:2Fe-2S iron-sulfur cluster-binding protein [Paracoccus benzoatiresistens]|uniref:2Fe-2S ferredoxin-type domain-containing protein n=1 Tax=Paracoccus benzoatiresistens TaxID=2997341 RepID=A0ABT4JAF1_9RHOB|nr:2Fe-2S iron-sulfur cluster-binding protein [Paracoccus sp. EF6]MCZ0963582.1 hypothetical protein [Paracoccus sp. EF6]